MKREQQPGDAGPARRRRRAAEGGGAREEREERRESQDQSGAFDGAMRAALLSVVGAAVVMTLGAAAAYGSRAALGVAIGGAIATANLFVFAKVGEAFISRKGRTAPWAVIAVIKLFALLGGVWLILRSGLVSPLSLTFGYASLIVGITLGTLFGPKPPPDPEPGAGDQA